MVNERKVYHILNGDALKDRFPEELRGEIIVARECLVDGTVEGEDLEILFQNRARFLQENYDLGSTEGYYNRVVSEFEKIRNIEPNSAVNLWFEDDLFCQVNLWFVSHLLEISAKDLEIFLIRPHSSMQYGFGGLSVEELIVALDKRKQILDIKVFSSLWKNYQNGNLNELLQVSEKIKSDYPFVTPAVEAHIARLSTEDDLGRPKESLLEIMEDLGTQEFGRVFKRFCEKEAIYGFGDLQVMRLYKEVMSGR